MFIQSTQLSFTGKQIPCFTIKRYMFRLMTYVGPTRRYEWNVKVVSHSEVLSFIQQSVLRQVQSLFQIELST